MPHPDHLARIAADLDALIQYVGTLSDPKLSRFADRLVGARHEFRDVVALEGTRGQ